MASSRVIDKDKGFSKFFKRLRELDGLEAVVGILAKQGAQVREGGITMVELGTIHEFGAPGAGIPQRSFLRSTFDENRNKYDRLLKDATKGVVSPRTASVPKRALFKVSQVARTDVVKKISSGIPPPNDPATIARKGSSLTLIDKGLLRGSIMAEVRKASPFAS